MSCFHKRWLFGPWLLVLSLSFFIVRSSLAFDSHKPFDISSDLLEYNEGTQELTAEGHVTVIQTSSTLTADLVRYDRLHKHLIARGKVVLRENGSIFVGDQMDYNLELQKGVVLGGKAYGSPWLFQGTSWEKNQDYYIGRNASFTSCDLIDPHYHIRSSRVHLIPDQYFWAWNNVFYLDTHPVFYTPFLYKSLGPRRVVFQVEPGNDTVKGAFAKTTTTLRFTDNVYDRLLIDEYTISGTGYGNEFDYKDKDYKGSLFGYYINPKGSPELVGAPKTEQFDIRAYHWQKMSDALTFQSSINHRKNVSFNNQFFTQDNNQSVTDIINSAALTYQKGRINQRLVMTSDEAPDANSDPLFADTHVQSASLPRYEVTLFQKPLWSPHISTSTLEQVLHPTHWGPLQLTANGSAEDFYSRIDDQTRVRTNAGATLSETINLSRNWSLTPTVTPSLHWQDKFDPFVPPTTTTVTVIPIGVFRGYQGRLGTSDNLRYRPASSLTLDQTYNLTARLAPNGMTLDRALQDGGIETDHLNWVLFWRPSRLVMLRSLSGYDLRTIADEDPNAYRQRVVDPWTNELTFQPLHSLWDYFFRYQLGYYPTHAQLWEADVRGHFAHKTLYETGLSYNASQPGLLTWNNKIGFYLSPSWRVTRS